MHILEDTAHNNKELLKVGFSASIVLVYSFVYCYEELKSL